MLAIDLKQESRARTSTALFCVDKRLNYFPGIKYMAAATHGDVIHYSWVMDCCTAKDLLPVRPKCATLPGIFKSF